MNDDELNHLEAKLRSWRPRRPSPVLKWRLALASGSFFPNPARFAGWFVPATACLLLAMLNLNSAGSFSGFGRSSMTGLILSNQSSLYFWPESRERGENCPPAQIFKWTNADSSTSSMRSASVQN